jgi:hypothetical protein
MSGWLNQALSLTVPMMGLVEDLNSTEFQHGVQQQFWELLKHDVTSETVYVRLNSPDNRSYVISLLCDHYGEQAIHGRFVDPATLQCVASAWPQGDQVFEQWIKFRDAPGHLFICWDQDRGGIGHHQDWAPHKAWARKSNQLVAYLDFLRQVLWIPARGYIRI